jgi:hypothetical protein
MTFGILEPKAQKVEMTRDYLFHPQKLVGRESAFDMSIGLRPFWKTNSKCGTPKGSGCRHRIKIWRYFQYITCQHQYLSEEAIASTV